ncbi:MAG TPA: YDG domain-containing protein [Stellaceae bacterium]|jgi:hypothetical protein
MTTAGAAGWDFTTTWAPPSTGFYPQLYALSPVVYVATPNAISTYGTAPVFSPTMDGGGPSDYVFGPSGDTLATPTVGAGFSATTSVGTYAITGGSPIASSDGVSYRVVYTGSLTVDPLAVTLSGTRQYDGTTGASSSILTIGNDLDGGNLTLSGSGTLASKNVGGEALTSFAGLSLGGSAAGNYTLTGASGSVNIAQALLTIAAVSDSKTYDGTTVSTLTPTVGTLYGSDMVSGLGQTFASKNVLGANGSTLNVAGYIVNDGNGGNNYAVTLQASPGTIAPATVSASLVGAASKIYDGTTAANLSSSNYALGGVIGSDTVSASGSAAYASANVGSGSTIHATGLTLAGTDAGNYVLGSTNASGAIGAITPATLTYVANPATRRGDAPDPAFAGGVTGFVGGDTLASATSGSAVFATPATITSAPGRYAIDGSGLAALNYVFAQAVGNATALTITPAPGSVISTIMPPSAAELLALEQVYVNWAASPGAGLAPTLGSGWAPLAGWLAQFQDSGDNSLVAQSSIFLQPITYVGGGIVTAALPSMPQPQYAAAIQPW